MNESSTTGRSTELEHAVVDAVDPVEVGRAVVARRRRARRAGSRARARARRPAPRARARATRANSRPMSLPPGSSPYDSCERCSEPTMCQTRLQPARRAGCVDAAARVAPPARRVERGRDRLGQRPAAPPRRPRPTRPRTSSAVRARRSCRSRRAPAWRARPGRRGRRARTARRRSARWPTVADRTGTAPNEASPGPRRPPPRRAPAAAACDAAGAARSRRRPIRALPVPPCVVATRQ